MDSEIEKPAEEIVSHIKSEIDQLAPEQIEAVLSDLEWVLKCVDGKVAGNEICERCLSEENMLSPVLEICFNARKKSSA